MSTRVYPLPRPEDDPRFTYGLHFDVAAVLEAHGYPRPTGPDFVELGQTLFRFLYAAEATEQLPAPIVVVDPVTGRDYAEEAWQRAEAEREGLAELAAEQAVAEDEALDAALEQQYANWRAEDAALDGAWSDPAVRRAVRETIAEGGA